MTRAESRACAIELVRELLDIDLDTSSLLRLAADVLGDERLAACERRIRAAPLSRRGHNIASIAAFVVTTRTLGEAWWSAAVQGATADDVLARLDADPAHRGSLVLDALHNRAGAAGADAMWGAPYADVDLNSVRIEDRCPVPAGGCVGDRFVLSFDPGSRVDAVVVARADGTLGTDLELDTIRHAPPGEASWGWGIATGHGPHRFAAEVPGTADDPYAAPLEEGVAAAIRTWAASCDAEVGGPWLRVGDLLAALDQAPYQRSPWDRAALALMDGNTVEAMRLLKRR